MKMEVIAVQQYQTQYGNIGVSKVKDWTSTLTPPTPSQPSKAAAAATKAAPAAAITAATAAVTTANTVAAAAAALPYLQSNTTNKIKNSITKKTTKRTVEVVGSKTRSAASVGATAAAAASNMPSYHTSNNNNLYYCEDIDASAVKDLSLRLLDELRAAKSRHLTCTEVSLPCDLTPRIAAEIIRVSAKEPCGIRGCTIYIEFEDEPNNSRRIATLRLHPETVSTFEVYLTLRQDHSGWTALLPQFMKSLARTITISPEFTITKHKLYSPPQQRGYGYGGRARSGSNAISTPSS